MTDRVLRAILANLHYGCPLQLFNLDICTQTWKRAKKQTKWLDSNPRWF